MIFDQLREHFDLGKSVCPFAKSVTKYYFTPVEFALNVQLFGEAIKKREVAIVFFPGWRHIPHKQAGEFCCGMLEQTRKLVGSNDYRPGTPFVRVGDDVAYVIGMGPQYPKEHPRYAPVLCLVAVNEAAIREVPMTVRGPIWRAVLERTGGDGYDLDQVWVPLPGAEK